MSENIHQLVLNGKVKASDMDGELYMLHFVEGSDDCTIRGDVFAFDKDICVCKGMGMIIEQDWKQGLTLQSEFACEVSAGTVLRLFFYNNRWRIVTNRKLDAFQTSWGGLNFGDQLMLAVGTDNDSFSHWLATSLNTDTQYLVLLQETGNAVLLATTTLGKEWVPILSNFPSVSGLQLPTIVSTDTIPSESMLVFYQGQWTRLTTDTYRWKYAVCGNEINVKKRVQELQELDPSGFLLSEYMLIKPVAMDITLEQNELWNNMIEPALLYNNPCVQMNAGQASQWNRLTNLYTKQESMLYYQIKHSALDLWSRCS